MILAMLQRVAATEGEDESLRLELHVLDPLGRDVHLLATTAPPDERAQRIGAMQELLLRGYWVSPRTPEPAG